jgi:hypothetical protein
VINHIELFTNIYYHSDLETYPAIIIDKGFLTMCNLYPEFRGANIVFYNNAEREVELGLLPADSTKDEWLRFFNSLGEELKVPLPIESAPYSANDIFNPDGTLRGIKIIRDKRSVRSVTYIRNNKVVARINRNAKDWLSEISYLILRMCLELKVPDNSITATLIKVALSEMMKFKAGELK